MNSCDPTPLRLAEGFLGRAGIETDRLACVIRRRLSAFLEECHDALSQADPQAPSPRPGRRTESLARRPAGDPIRTPADLGPPPGFTASIYAPDSGLIAPDPMPTEPAAVASHAELARRRQPTTWIDDATGDFNRGDEPHDWSDNAYP